MRANSRRARAGAVTIAMSSAAFASAAAGADAQTKRLPLFLDDRSVTVGQSVEASGRPGRAYAGRTVVLEHRDAGGAWAQVGQATVDRKGVYRIEHRFERPGALRAVLQPAAGEASASSSLRTSAERTVRVAPAVALSTRRLNVRAGSRATVSGRVKTGKAGVTVTLQVRRGSRWIRLDRDRTSSTGRFVLRDRVSRTLSAPVRVAVGSHGGLSPARRRAGRLNVYRTAHASWYGPGFYGQRTGCGGILRPGQLGVAHKTLPCGTKVTFRHRGRTVRVRVIDRGPYVGGREYDLTQATAQRLGFSGHGAVLTTR